MIIMLSVGLGLVVLLLILGAFFSAIETAVTALNRVDLSALKEQDQTLGKRVEELLRDPERLIAALLIGNNIANTAAPAILVYVVGYYFRDIFIAPSTVVLTLFIIIFSEIAPKQLALIYKRRISMKTVGLVDFFYKLFSPLQRVIIWFTGKIFPILSRERAKENLEESLEHMIDLAKEQGFIDPYEREFIHNVLDLNDKVARQIMTHRKDVFSVLADELLAEVYPKMIEHSYSRVPVCQNTRNTREQIVGLLYLSDVQKFFISPPSLSEHSEQPKVWNLMKPVSFLPDSSKVSALFFHFKQNEGNLVIILDEYGGLAGVVSQEDVLEAVFGNLYDEDEKDEKTALHIRKDGAAFEFSGLLSIQQFEYFFDLELHDVQENTRLATMSGYLCDLLGYIPEQNELIETAEGRFRVLESDGKRILRLRFEPAQRPRDEVSVQDGQDKTL